MEHTAVVDAGYTHTDTHKILSSHSSLLYGSLTPLHFSFFLAYALGPGHIPISICLDLMTDPKMG